MTITQGAGPAGPAGPGAGDDETKVLPLSSLPVLIDPIIVLRLLHHWILSRKIGHPPSRHHQQQQIASTTTISSTPAGLPVLPTKRKSSHQPYQKRPAVRRELSLPADERVISQLEAQLLPHVTFQSDIDLIGLIIVIK